MKRNLILDVDSYKTSHFYQYPPKTESIFGYLESRGGHYGKTVFFGLQYLLKEYLLGPVVTGEDIAEADAFCKAHGVPFPLDGWTHILMNHGGKLPVRIRAVPEGTVVPTGHALMTVESTDPIVPWVATWLETQLMRLWYPITVATRSWFCKKVILEYLVKTANAPLSELPFKLHDFGARGVSSRESAGIGGAAHLVNFQGSDTIEGIRLANHYYDAKMAGFSIPAMEHSTVTSWGREHEAAAYRNMVTEGNKRGFKMNACVSDSYDFFTAVERIWCDELRDLIQIDGHQVVIRPDSGDPAEVNLKALQILERKLGMSQNGKGYKILPPNVRLIQGDGNDDEESIRKVLQKVTENGYSASNMVFGMGGGLLQKLDRDTQRFAFKVSEITVDGVPRDVRKMPKTDPSKGSKAGRLDLVVKGGKYTTVPIPAGQVHLNQTEMLTVFENGESRLNITFDAVRRNAEKGMM